MLVLDLSSSVKRFWTDFIVLAAELVHSLRVGRRQARVALVQYSSHWRCKTRCHLDSNLSGAQIEQLLRMSSFLGGLTATATALKRAAHELQPKFGGERTDAKKVRVEMHDLQPH